MPKKRTHFEHLKEKWTKKHRKLHNKLWKKHKKALNWALDKSKKLAIGSGFAGAMLLTASPGVISNILPTPDASAQAQSTQNIDKKALLIYDLLQVLPDSVRPLTKPEEDVIAQTLTRHFGIIVTPELQGKRLNRSYGIIGAEQHLARFPGDWSSRMAPGLGAWGYFTQSRSQLTEKDILREKYYIAVQTFLSKDFNNRVKEYIDFYKYRKMLLVNPDNGKSIVADIADSGPAVWTGKHLGGSPEVMKYLERVDGAQRGPVLYFFIDDPQDNVPLGPISVK